jgi:hypothetical protein
VKMSAAAMLGIAIVGGALTIGFAQAQGPAPRSDGSVEPRKPIAQNASGSVKTAGADSLVVSGKARGGKATEWTFAVGPTTRVRKAGKDIPVTELVAGDPVLVRYHQLGGKNVADVVMVRAARRAAPVSAGATPSGKGAATK